MSHELRTPLNSILGFAQLLELEDLSPEPSDNVQHILRGGRHLLELINENICPVVPRWIPCGGRMGPEG